MRFALAPVFTATVAVSVAFVSRPASGQDPAPAAATTPEATEVTDPKPLLDKGEAALKAGDYAAAMAAFNEAGKAAQQALAKGEVGDNQKFLATATVGRGRAQTGLREFEAAEKDFRDILQQEPGYLPALVGLGQLKLEDGKPDEAIDQFQNAVKADPTSIDALFGYGKSLVQLGRGDEAIAPLTRVVTMRSEKRGGLPPSRLRPGGRL